MEHRFDSRYMTKILGSSLGTQPKYYEDGYWYKRDQKGYEGLAEELVSRILAHTNIENYVVYETCEVDGRSGCRSKEFTGEREVFISYARLYQLRTGGDLSDRLMQYSDPADRIRFTRDFIEEETMIDQQKYLSQILSLDAFTLNTDRHLNNLGVILDEQTGQYKAAPVFDNGAALLSDFGLFDPYRSIEENVERVTGKPFYANLMRQADLAEFDLKVDYDAVNALLDAYPQGRIADVVRYQMKQCEAFFKK